MSAVPPPIAQANAASNDTGRNHGSPAQQCPLCILTVTVESDDPKVKLGNVAVKATGPTPKSAKTKGGKPLKWKGVNAGDYQITATAKGWYLVGGPQKATVPAGGSATKTLKLAKCKLDKVTPDQGDRWHINLDADQTKKTGRTVDVVAEVTPKKQDIEVFFVLAEHKKNFSGLMASLKPALSAAKVKTDANGQAKTTLTLSRYSGDKVRISASLEDGKKAGASGTKTTAWFQSWQRVFYQVDVMKRPGGTKSYSSVVDTTTFEKEYKRHCVEAKRVGGDSAPAHKRAVAPATLANWDAWAGAMRKKPTGNDARRYFHMVVLDTVGAAAKNPQAQTYNLSRVKGTLKIPGANEAFDDTDWFQGTVEIQRFKKVSGTDTAQGWQAVASPANHLRLSTTGTNEVDYQIQYDLANVHGLGAGPALPAAISKLQLRITLVHHTPLSGMSWGDSIAVAIRWREASHSGKKLRDSTTNTLIHEAGHNLGLAPKPQPDGTQRADPASYYYQAGPHCHESSNTCVMWHANLTKYKFCDKCGRGLRGRNINSLPILGSAAL